MTTTINYIRQQMKDSGVYTTEERFQQEIKELLEMGMIHISETGEVSFTVKGFMVSEIENARDKAQEEFK